MPRKIGYTTEEKMKALKYADRTTRREAADWMRVKADTITEWAKELGFVFSPNVFDSRQRLHLKDLSPEKEPDPIMRKRLMAIQSIEDFAAE